MKFIKLLSLFAFACICSIAHAQETTQDVSDSKITKMYIEPNQIQFDENNIYVCINQNWTRTTALYTDRNGFYIVDEQGGWTCPRCNTYNTSPYDCIRCGYSRIRE